MAAINHKIIKLPRVKDTTGKSRSSIYDGIKKGTFPAPISIGVRAVGWLESDIDAWLENCVNASKAA
jgi:prophage regulatory protein